MFAQSVKYIILSSFDNHTTQRETNESKSGGDQKRTGKS